MSIIIILIILISLIEYIGDSNFKHYARNSRYHNLIIGAIAYIFVVILLIHVLKKTNVLYLNGAWDGISALIESILAFLLLKERLHNKYQYLGLILIVAGIFTLNMGPIPK